MNFISYAQNAEDVMLWRALKDVEHGFYIDIGAADPDEISVTKAFYDRLWSGINVEPTAAYFERLAEARPRDLNLNVAAGAAPGLMVLHEISGTGLSTGDAEIAHRHAADGWTSHEVTVPVLTLTSICESQGVADIHFLKVDVEGTEAEVLRGMDFGRFRPWIVLVEATEPLSSSGTEASWKDLLLGQRYQRAYFDGLNAFYVADEHAGLADMLNAPPNVFDTYIPVRQQVLEAQVEEHVHALQALSDRIREQDDALGRELAEAKETVQRARLHADQLKRRLDAVQPALEAGEAERETLLAERDALLFERDALLAERNTLLAERATLADKHEIQSARSLELHQVVSHLTLEQDRLRGAHSTIAGMLEAMRVSTSWRVTGPVRVAGRAMKAALQRSPRGVARDRDGER